MLPRKLTLQRLHNKEAHTCVHETLAHDNRPLQNFQPVWAVLIISQILPLATAKALDHRVDYSPRGTGGEGPSSRTDLCPGLGGKLSQECGLGQVHEEQKER